MNREEFFTKNTTPKTTDVELEDGRIEKVRKLSQAEVETLKKRYSTEDKSLEGLRYVVSRCTVDAAGERIFEDDDMKKLETVDFDIINKIATEAMRFSGLTVPKNT